MKGKEKSFDKDSKNFKLEKMTISQVSENQMSKNELTKKRSLQERGITLIALVVTIIILLILAGVTISQITGNEGLFQRTKQAAEQYEKESLREEMRLAILDKQIENSGEITRKRIIRYFRTISEKYKKMKMVI